MIIPQWTLRAFSPQIFDAVQAYKVTDDTLMPWAYQHANPQGRPYHDDWGIMSSNPVLIALQPFQKIPRIETAYRVPLPLKQTKGLCSQQWMLWDPSYPASPGLKTEIRADGYTYALVDCAVEGSGASEFSAFINGAWKPVFTQYRRMIFGRLLAHYSGGLKGDVTVTPQPGGAIKSDIMGWWDPPSLSYNAP
jgi:hypothetical protein